MNCQYCNNSTGMCDMCRPRGQQMTEREGLKPRTEEEVNREAEKIIHALLEKAAQNWIKAQGNTWNRRAEG